MLSLSGFKLFLFLVDILPAVLNKRSEAKLDAQLERYFLASCDKTDNTGKDKWFIFHHCSSLLSGSGLEIIM